MKNFQYAARHDFLNKLYTVVHPAGPIDANEFLFGRSAQVQTLETSLYAPGRHVFIFGDRGVGKSSLAHTVAFNMQEQNEPILVSCVPESTLAGVIADAFRDAVKRTDSGRSEWSASTSIGVGATWVKLEHKKHSQQQEKIEINDISSAVYALGLLTKFHSDAPYIVIDEFDRISSIEEKEKFGTLLKQLGDKKSPVKIIFTGIGESLHELLGGHASSSRQIQELKLEPLSWSGRYDIIDRAFNEFNLSVPDDIRFRIAGLSDGFPHYVHLICEKMLIRAYQESISDVDFNLFTNGLSDAVSSVAEFLKKDYNTATEGRSPDIAYVLWAVADSADMQRKKGDIFISYSDVIEQLAWKKLISDSTPDDKKFSRILSSLVKPAYGEIVVSAFEKRRGFYKFKESMVRGYVKMHAEIRAIKLDFEKNFTSNEPTVKAKSSVRGRKKFSQIEQEIEREESNKKRNEEILKELSREYAKRSRS
ncbi:AAA family ATPase [Pectobacterium aroidearum]|uniref:AAA family ATPase n=1 Tax=Pectobacterium aroidearum TaxID=1201031 RepID=UPI002114EC2A|nr:ATP-binding protein [Pectobacterium aroidearum]UUE59004.1 ATP-binding protein [Pectobacterium aroidearum]UUE71831.1 ATP-binding protein [Pectobacterium aroidearum]UUE76231.1 ATP-binding protein [Pectobacterium aroidearum]UUE80456.1 ATP-binding protein [Pectobacterium aroidearum]